MYIMFVVELGWFCVCF